MTRSLTNKMRRDSSIYIHVQNVKKHVQKSERFGHRTIDNVLTMASSTLSVSVWAVFL